MSKAEFYTVGWNSLHRAMWKDISMENSGHFVEGQYKKNDLFHILLYKFVFNKVYVKLATRWMKAVWYSKFSLTKKYNSDKEIYIVLPENRVCYYPEDYFLWLQNRNSNVHYVLIYLNPYQTSGKKVIEYKNISDFVFSYDPEDAKKYNFLYIPLIYSVNYVREHYSGESQISNHVCFVGEQRGRLNVLQNCFFYLKKHGVKSLFYITNVKKDLQKYAKEVHYNRELSYDELIEKEKISNCILEILRAEQPGATLRCMEAVALRKKFVTNNKKVVSLSFFDDRYIQVIEKPEDISISFLLSEEKVEYEYNDEYSPIRIIRVLQEKMKDNCKNK